jgi:membrane protease YdiL (CAAX protease family)
VSGPAAWARLAAVTTAAVTLPLLLAPPRPRPHTSWSLATALGAAVGLVLFAVVAHRPPLPARAGPRGAVAVRQLLLGIYAANEELLWRRLLLGELLPVGPVTALAVSSAAFAAAHARARRLHAATGAVFGGLYLATGCLGASIAAHWVYNAFVSALLGRAPP